MANKTDNQVDLNIKAGFLRQRRNLMLMSVLMCSIAFLELNIAEINKITLLGTEVMIGNPSGLFHLLWVFMVYFMIRYCQYFHDLGDIGYKDYHLKKRAYFGRDSPEKILRGDLNKAHLYIFCRTRYFSEYILPIIFSAFSFIYFGYNYLTILRKVVVHDNHWTY